MIAQGQTPVPMASQTNYTYTENFADISNWTFKTNPDDGTFISGNGALAWRGLEPNNVGAIPSATKITTNSTFFQIPPSGNGGYSSGIYKGNQKLEMLSTGTTNNTSSVAIDFYMNFTGVNAGTLSFDWASINNSTGNRSSSLRVYASVDGVTFNEIIAAAVLNFTNNNPTAGSIVNVSLPTMFNNAPSAFIRFYYYNGTGGSSGSRPRLSIDNIKVTALPTTPCTTPTAQPTNFSLGNVTHNAISFSFDDANPSPNDYLILMSNSDSLTTLPVNGTTYNVEDELGDATIVGITNNTIFTATNLNLSTTYYFFIFSVNNSCTGGPLYLTTSPLIGYATTTAGALPCSTPTSQPTNLTFNNITTSSISGSFSAASNTDEYLIIRSLSSSFTGTLNDGTTYNGGMVLGNGTVVTRTAGTSFTVNNLSSGTNYYFYIFGLNKNDCTGGPVYNSSNPLTGNISTTSLPPCIAPTDQPTQLNFVASNNYINGYFEASSSADGYIIIRTTTSTLSSNPQNNNTYTAGSAIGNGLVVQSGTSTAFIDVNLAASTTYYYHIFAMNNNCTGGVKYLTTNPLIGNATTTAIAASNWYFGNLHSHSSYSDGNQDNTSLTPSDDYAYAKNSLCMDFLGISEHNHSGTGMNISKWQPGLAQAAAATTSDFLALYGMEWGVISNGGHVLVYGTDQLIGWETNNYNVYVPKSNYLGTPETNNTTGLFRTINNLGGNTFATLAHPNFSDYNGLANTSYNATADSAIVGSAVASGIAFSTNTTYSNPPTSYGYFDFYTRLLSKGYHIGPTMDHDNHYTNFGRSNNNRLVVVAPSLTQNNFYTAMRNRSFYATEDCDTKVVFTLNNTSMGNIISDSRVPAITVYANDPTSPSSTPTIRLMYGVVGNGALPFQVAFANNKVLSYTDFALTQGTNGYYYADILINGKRTVTAPIWYTKNAVVPVKLVSFKATLNTERNWVNISWSTINEINNNYFVVEKSDDGIHFKALDTVKANNLQGLNNYSILDKEPYAKTTYYRLKQVDVDGSFTYSQIVAVQLNLTNYTFDIHPNPVRDIAIASITSATSYDSKIIITDITGRVVKYQTIKLQRGTQQVVLNLSNLQQGNYQASIYLNGQYVTRKILKL